MAKHVHTIGCSRRKFLASAGTGALVAGALPIGSQAFAATPPAVTGKAPAKLQPFDMADVTLAESPFLHAQRMTEAYLLSLSPDRMLHNFRKNAGLEPKAPVYVDGRLLVTLKGDRIVAEFLEILEEYVASRYGVEAVAARS